jgi:hypothetical protein
MAYNFKEYLTGVDVFLSSWCNGSSVNSCAIKIRKSYAGNINRAGLAMEGAEAYLLPINHAQFWDSIEKGIKPLVRFFTEDQGLITFTSCEGHLYKNGSYSPRNIGIIMRSEDELNFIILLISDVTKMFNQEHKAIKVKFYSYDMIDDKKNSHKAIKIIFDRANKTTISEYFLNLDHCTSRYLLLLQNEASINGNSYVK